MPVFKNSRYSNTKIAEIIDDKTLRKRKYLHLRQFLNAASLKDNYTVYIVQKNEELDLIASKFGIDPSQWWIIAEINQLFFPFDIKEGQKIIVPFAEFLNKIT